MNGNPWQRAPSPRRPPHRPRSGAGTLIFVAFMAIVFLCAIGLFQFMGEQISRGQKIMNESVYARYLGDAALTEATVELQRRIDQGESIEDLFGQEIATPVSFEVGTAILGRTVDQDEIKVTLVADSRAAVKANYRPSDPNAITDYNQRFVEIAFDGEQVGTAVLMAELSIGSIRARMTRGFEFRQVSPAAPTGIDQVTFLGHKWGYFQGRVLQAHTDLFSLAAEAELVRAYGKLMVEDRGYAYRGSVLEAKSVADLSEALAKTTDPVSFTQDDGQSLIDDLKAKIRDQCNGDCVWIQGGAAGLDRVVNYMMLSYELRKAWEEQIYALHVLCNPSDTTHGVDQATVQRLQQEFQQAQQQAQQTGNNSGLGTACGALSAYLGRGSNNLPGGKTMPQPSSKWEELDKQLITPLGETVPGTSVQGMAIRQAQHPSIANSGVPVEEWAKAAASRYADAGTWKSMVKIIDRPLKERIEQIRAEADSAGDQYTYEALKLWNDIDLGELENNTKDAVTALGELKISAATDADNLDYPHFAAGASSLGANYTDLKTLIQRYQDEEPKLERVFDDYVRTRNFSDVFSKLQQKKEKFKDGFKDYLIQDAVRNITVGPVYIPKGGDLDNERLQYTYRLNPLRTNMVELFPLAWPPWKSATGNANIGSTYQVTVKDKHRGFLTVHGNWGRQLEGGVTYEPDYEVSGGGQQMLDALRKTPGLAMENFDALKTLVTQTGNNSNPAPTGGGPCGPNSSNTEPCTATDFFQNGVQLTQTQQGQATDAEVIQAWKDGWDDKVEKFMQSLRDSHQRHTQIDLKGWPGDPPGDHPDLEAETKGLDPIQGGDYFGSSKGAVYVDHVLHPEINKARAAFRFPSMADFESFLATNGAKLYGTYYIDENPAVLDATKIVSAKGAGVIDGRAYLAFPGSVRIQGQSLSADPGPLVIVAQSGGGTSNPANPNAPNNSPPPSTTDAALELVGGGTVKGVLMCNGTFASTGGQASIEGTLVTTGTLTEDPQEPDPNIQVRPEDYASDNTLYGRLKQFNLRYDDSVLGGKDNRKEFLKLIVAPFRVAQDYEVRREAR